MADDRARQEESRRTAVASAQALEKRGQLDAAIQAFLSAGSPEDAARVMIQQRRFREAAGLLMEAVGASPEGVSTLDAPRKKLALQAAICFSRAGEAIRAATLFVGLGERDRAVDALRKAGEHITADRVLAGGPVAAPVGTAAVSNAPSQAAANQAAQALEASSNFEPALDAYLQLRQPQNAARMAIKLGRMPQAAELFGNAGMHYEAAEAFWRAGDARQSLDSLLHVPREDPRYRQCCLLVIKLASELDALDIQLDHFVGKFLSEAPQNDREIEAFYLIGKLYQKHNYFENAKSTYLRVIAASPNFRDVQACLQAVEAEDRASPMVYEKIVRDNESFRGGSTIARSGSRTFASAMPGLPPLPDLPPMPGGGGGIDDGRTVASVPQSMRSAPTPVPGRAGSPVARPIAGAPRAAPQSVPPPVPVQQPVSAEVLLTVGSVVADRYRLEAKIGQGGMAAVFRAFDLELNEQIAMKVFTQKVDDEQLVTRFKQELSLSRQLHHPNIIRLYDIGSVQGFRYITMELLSGADLKSKLGSPLDIQAGISIILQVCSALQHVHDKGVVHRDIKPANLFLTDDGIIKLMDFGIAKRQATPGLTVAGMIAGTPEYMSPEQINGFDKVSASTDLYALGIMAYEIFAGSVPFKHKELMPLLVMHMKDRPPPLRDRNPNISPDLEEIVLKLLEKDPARRFESCAELAGALQLL